MSFEGVDPGFVGPAYEAPMLLQDAQRCINWFLEIDKNPRAKMPIALLAAPGLNPVFGTKAGPVRGGWVLPGGLTALFVTADTVYLATITIPATQTSIAQFSVQPVGVMGTTTGRVVIRDNGQLFPITGLGGYAVLVDGIGGYYYRLSGAGSVTFTGNLVAGQSIISFPPGQLVPANLLVSSAASLIDSGNSLPVGTNLVAVSYTANNISVTQAALANVTADMFTLKIPQFGKITDPAFLGSDRVIFIEGWLGFNQPGSRTYYTNAPFAYTMTFAGLFYALKDSSSDNLVTMMENNREWWLIGERTTEVAFNAGGGNFSFQRLPGIGPQIGCSAKHSIARLGPDLAWLAQNENGQNIVVKTNQYSYERISNHAIEKAISSYPQVSDAIGDCYEELGHVMYVLTFPTADVTWVYDLSTEQWWQRLSWNPNTGIYHRHIGNAYVNFGNLRMWGDYLTGQVHQQDRAFFTDAGAPLRATRRTPHVWSKEDRKRIKQASLQVEFGPGVGLQTGQGSNPQAMIRWSDDGGEKWSNEHFVSIGKVGTTKNRAIVRRLGDARDRVYEVTYTEPTPRDIIGATLFGENEDSPG